VFGPNIDYVLALDRALREHGLHDPYIEAIMARMREASEAP